MSDRASGVQLNFDCFVAVSSWLMCDIIFAFHYSVSLHSFMSRMARMSDVCMERLLMHWFFGWIHNLLIYSSAPSHHYLMVIETRLIAPNVTPSLFRAKPQKRVIKIENGCFNQRRKCFIWRCIISVHRLRFENRLDRRENYLGWTWHQRADRVESPPQFSTNLSHNLSRFSMKIYWLAV